MEARENHQDRRRLAGRGFFWQLLSAFLCTFLVVLLLDEAGSRAEAKKLKLKDLKKLKKYAVLLAGQRKILYAIPFPLPLPVFVKRQHIYTHVPIIPRYVQQPSHSPSPYYYPTMAAMGHPYAAGHDPYGSMSEHSTQVAEHPVLRQPTERYKPTADTSSTEHGDTSGVASKSPRHQPSANAGKYLVQLASTLVGQGSLGSLLGASTGEQMAGGGGGGTSQVAKKLLGGSQAKLMSPSAFVATLRGRPASGAASGAEQQELLAEGGSSKLGKYTASELAQMSSLRAPAYQPAPPSMELPLYMAPPSAALYRMPPTRVQPGYLHLPTPAAYYAPQPGMRHSVVPEPMQHLDEQQLPQAEEPTQLEMAASEAGQLATLRALVEAKQHQQQQLSQMSSPAQLTVDELKAAESNLLALRAHQLGLASARLRLLNY